MFEEPHSLSCLFPFFLLFLPASTAPFPPSTFFNQEQATVDTTTAQGWRQAFLGERGSPTGLQEESVGGRLIYQAFSPCIPVTVLGSHSLSPFSLDSQTSAFRRSPSAAVAVPTITRPSLHTKGITRCKVRGSIDERRGRAIGDRTCLSDNLCHCKQDYFQEREGGAGRLGNRRGSTGRTET